MNKPVKIGLVLAGGGALGAYQVGVLRYLAELEYSPHIIAGTSIGALNGAVIASHPTLAAGVADLDQIWTNLGEADIIRPNDSLAWQIGSYLALSSFPTFSNWFNKLLLAGGLNPHKFSFFDPMPLESMIQEKVDPTALRQGTELWATVFPAFRIPGLGYDITLTGIDLVRAATGTKAEWLRVQDFEDDETILSVLLASAAIPLCFPNREINGKTYVDGALQDNIPLGALAQQGCTHAIVIHLEGGTGWNRYDFSDITIIEVRPQLGLNTSNHAVIGDMQAMLNFSSKRITQLKTQGYQDAQLCLQPIFETYTTFKELESSTQLVKDTTHELMNHQLLR